MKANEAPEKIWIDPATDLPKLSGHIDKNSVEYIRKDAFIEKACEFISFNIADYIDVTHHGGIERVELQERVIEEFRKYMEGE